MILQSTIGASWVWCLAIPGIAIALGLGVVLCRRVLRSNSSSRHCPECGFLLPGVSSPRCPACGESV
jgi:hypothetical protein